MPPLHATALMEIWDRGRDRHPIDRALVVLAFAYPEQPWEELGALPIGERNRRLLAVRAASFGPVLDIVTSCPRCGTALEFEFEFPLDRYAPSGPRSIELVVSDGPPLAARLPDSRDLAAVAASSDASSARRCLLERCVAPSHVAEDTLAAAFSAAVEREDPLAAIAFPVSCLDCAQPWRATLDPIDYLWRELERHVRAIVREIDVLARAYGWNEAEILGLSPGRRRLYLEQARSQPC